MNARIYAKKASNYGYISADPLPSEQDLTEHYSSKYYNAPSTSTYQTGYTDEEIQQKELRAQLVVHSLQHAYGKSLAGKCLFEVGYGEGFILDSAQKAGLEISGVDFTNAGVMRMNPHLNSFVAAENAYNHLDTLVKSNKKFDFCVMQNVLEHVIDPD